MSAADFIASGILEAYALGTATPEEIALAERMRVEHPSVEAEYQAIAASLEGSAQVYQRQVPPAVWEAIARAIAPTAQAVGPGGRMRPVSRPAQRPDPRPASGWQWASMAMAALLLASLGANYYLYKRKELLANQLAATERSLTVIAQTTSNITRDKDQLAAERTHLEGLLAQALQPGEGVIKMGAMPAAPRSRVLISYDRAQRMVALRAAGMPTVPQGKVVQLWAIVQGKPVSLGLAQGAAKNHMVLATMPEDMGEPEAFALSLESGKAHDSPQGPLLAMGKVY